MLNFFFIIFPPPFIFFFFFFNDTATTEIYTLSLHDAFRSASRGTRVSRARAGSGTRNSRPKQDRKSTRLNSSHSQISYAVFCLKKKNNKSRRSVRRR